MSINSKEISLTLVQKMTVWFEYLRPIHILRSFSIINQLDKIVKVTIRYKHLFEQNSRNNTGDCKAKRIQLQTDRSRGLKR